jgi:hypothetical protein
MTGAVPPPDKAAAGWYTDPLGIGKQATGTARVKTDTKIVAIAVGLITGFFAVLKSIHLIHEVSAAKGAAKMGYGLWVAVAACAGLIVAGFVETTPSGADV